MSIGGGVFDSRMVKVGGLAMENATTLTILPSTTVLPYWCMRSFLTLRISVSSKWWHIVLEMPCSYLNILLRNTSYCSTNTPMFRVSSNGGCTSEIGFNCMTSCWLQPSRFKTRMRFVEFPSTCLPGVISKKHPNLWDREEFLSEKFVYISLHRINLSQRWQLVKCVSVTATSTMSSWKV